MSASIYDPKTKTLVPFAGTSISMMSELSDVELSAPSDGQVLSYDATSQAWENADTVNEVAVTQVVSTGTKIATIAVDGTSTDLYAPAGGGGGASAVSDLTDVDLTNLQDDQYLKWDATNEKWVNASGLFIPESAEYTLTSYTVDLVTNGSYTQVDAKTLDYVISPTSGYEGMSIHLTGLNHGIIYFIKVDVELKSGSGRSSHQYPWKIGINKTKITSFSESVALSDNQFDLPITTGDKITYQFEVSASDYMTLNFFTGDAQNSATFRISNIRAGAVGNGQGSSVDVLQIQSTGTKIASISVDGNTTDLYAPEGGSSGGHTIEDSEGTELTQRNTMQFGSGLLASDDSTNAKTVVAPDTLQSGDMSDVITPLPSVQPRYHKYSTEEQVVGEWINGKPIYEKTINTGAFPSNSEKDVAHGISNIENIITYFGFAKRNDNVFSNIPISSNVSSALIQTDCNLTNIRLITGYSAASVYIDSYITLQYTKTTDTPNT